MERTTERMVKQEAARLGIPVEVSKPGDGQARYEFQMGGQYHFVCGSYAAWQFLRGVDAARWTAARETVLAR